MSRRCWTCNSEHDLDEACARPFQPGHEGAELDDQTSNLFDSAEEFPQFGPVFMATHDGEDACCGEGIVAGEDIRADGHGGWIHADDGCERMAR